jgi:hypothetical protein
MARTRLRRDIVRQTQSAYPVEALVRGAVGELVQDTLNDRADMYDFHFCPPIFSNTQREKGVYTEELVCVWTRLYTNKYYTREEDCFSNDDRTPICYPPQYDSWVWRCTF